MEIIQDAAAEYRAAHLRKLMVLTKTRNEAGPDSDEFCRIRAVETLSPGLWLTATFLDGTERRFRPEKVRVATPEEERRANEQAAAPGGTAVAPV